MSYFLCEESASTPQKFLIIPSFNKLPLNYTEGSFILLASRVMGLNYADYCRMCRDMYGAEIIGKNCFYLKVFFSNKADANKLINILNERMEKILNGHK